MQSGVPRTAAADAPAREEPATRLRVLHVVISAGSGVVAVVEDHIANTPEFEHHALVALDETCSIGGDLRQLSASVTELPSGAAARVSAIRSTVERIDPDIVHAHSSFAGAYVRVALPRRRQRHVVFTPHCYSFERADVSTRVRGLFRFAESVLSFRGRFVAACSPRETTLAEALPGRQRVTYVPNVVRDHGSAPPRAPRPEKDRSLVAATVGRVTAMKSPEFFGEAARRSKERGLDVDWVWVGGTGDDSGGDDELRRSGVRVTGWVPRPDARHHLETADVYVHCARWEGAPLTILEAAIADIPVVARRSSALAALGVAPLYDTVDELLDILEQFPDGPAFEIARDSIAGLRERHTNQRQRDALRTVYEAAGRNRAR